MTRVFAEKVDSRLLISQAGIMFPEPQKGASKVVYVFIAVLVLLLIVGGVSWFYFNNITTVEPVATAPTTNDTETVAEPTIQAAPTDIATSIAALDKELAAITQDEQYNEAIDL